MFARFKLANGEINVNTSLVRSFEPGTEEGTSKLTYLSGDAVLVPVSNQSVRHAFKKALATTAATEETTG